MAAEQETGPASWVAVDWGTSNLRAWGIGPNGSVAFTRSSDQGMGKLTRDAFPGVLATLLDGTVPARGNDPTPVLICGMAGARQGWMEAPYMETPADLDRLAHKAVTPPMPGSTWRPAILPGVCETDIGREDVMRGEETQLLGLANLIPGFEGLVVMPGTHSKWVRLTGRIVERFSSVMTGELFELLRTHSVLRHSLGGETDGPEREIGFDAGVEASLAAPERLTGSLFKVRAASLLSGRSAAWCAGYLSGLLIGSEIGGHHDWLSDGEIPLVGGVALCELYARAFSQAGRKARVVDATDATIAGLKAARVAQ